MKRLIIAGLAMVLIVAASVGIVQRQLLADILVARTHELQPAAAALLPRLELTEAGERIYRASRAEILDSTAFNKACKGAHREHSIVLGCYTGQIFVYNVTEEKLAGVREVTAVHELLHAAYERLGQSEKAYLNKMLEAELKRVTDKRLLSVIRLYEESTPEQLLSELHSLFGTERANLPDELERHYGRYVKNRQQIVGYAKAYEATFRDIERQVALYDRQLKSLAEESDVLENTLRLQRVQLEKDKLAMDQYRANNNVAAYNAMVAPYNQLVNTYNQGAGRLQAIVAEYNEIVKKRNNLALTQNNLVQKLDSNHQPL